MKAYRDSKCAWGYKTLCDECAKNNKLKHVFVQEGGLASPPALGKIQKCEDCDKRYVLVAGTDTRSEQQLREDYKKEEAIRKAQEEEDWKKHEEQESKEEEEFTEKAVAKSEGCKLCGDSDVAVDKNGICDDCADAE